MKVQVTYDQIISVNKISIEEAETVVNFNRISNEAELYTTDNTVITKMRRVMEKSNNYKCYADMRKDGSIISYTFVFPKKLISFRNGNKQMNESNKQKASDRFKKMWADKKSATKG